MLPFQCKVQLKSQQGIALIFTLCLLQAVAIINLFLLETTQLSKKMTKGFFQANQIHNQTAAIFSKIVTLDCHSCYIQTTLFSEIKNYPKTWWKENGCIMLHKNLESYYVCELLNQALEDKKIIKYWRFTVMITHKNSVREWLQIPYTTIDNASDTHMEI